MVAVNDFFATHYPIKDMENYTDDFYYQRVDHPLAQELEKELCFLEGGKYGLCFSFGMGAIHSFLFKFLKSCDRMTICQDMYAGTIHQCLEFIRFDVRVDIIDMRDLQKIKDHIRNNLLPRKTSIVFFETPSNPQLWLVDIEEVSRIVHEKYPECLVVVDNSFCTPVLQKPLSLGADIVISSTTKLTTGHGTTGGGIIVFNEESLKEKLQDSRTGCGTIQKPFDAQQHLQQIKTINERVFSQSVKAEMIAEELEKHSRVEQVRYPTLDSFDQKDLAAKQMHYNSEPLGGVMMAIYLKGNLETAVQFLKKVPLTKSVSTGCLETLVQSPVVANRRTDRQGTALLPDNLIRMSVSNENPEETLDKIDWALCNI